MKKYYKVKEIQSDKIIKNKKQIGRSLDDVLESLDILDECTAEAEKEALVHQIEEAMLEKKISKTTLAISMKTSRAAVDRLLDPHNNSVTLNTLEKVAKVFNKKLIIKLIEK